jgi:hypothetical protein
MEKKEYNIKIMLSFIPLNLKTIDRQENLAWLEPMPLGYHLCPSYSISM